MAMGKVFEQWDFFHRPWPKKWPWPKKVAHGEKVNYSLEFYFNRHVHGLDGQ